MLIQRMARHFVLVAQPCWGSENALLFVPVSGPLRHSYSESLRLRACSFFLWSLRYVFRGKMERP
jgi:hypothetical protein